MLIIGQPDHMLRDLRNSKGSPELSAISMWIVVSGDNHNVLNIVFSLCMSESLVKVQDTAMSLLRCSHSSYFLLEQPPPNLCCQYLQLCTLVL